MLTEKKKTMLIITLTAIALLINISMLLGLILDKEASDSYNHFLYEIRIIFWGWLLIIALAAAAMGTTLHWKPGRVLLRGLVIFFSITTILFSLAVMWMLIAMLSLKP